MKKDKASFYYFALVHLIAISLFMFTGCATQDKSAGFGGLIGAGAGAAIGGIADPGKKGEYRTRNIIVGSAVGGITGLIAGSVIHDEMESQRKESFQKGRASAPKPQSGAAPSLLTPKIESRWVEGKVSGNRYIEGHFEYVIIEPARWED